MLSQGCGKVKRNLKGLASGETRRKGIKMRYTYTFDQLRGNDAGIEAMFMSYDWAQRHGGVDPENYFTADSGTIEAVTPKAACKKLFRFYNARDNLTGYAGRSMNVSDIVNLWDNEQDPPVKTSWYCDSIGFVQINDKGEAI